MEYLSRNNCEWIQELLGIHRSSLDHHMNCGLDFGKPQAGCLQDLMSAMNLNNNPNLEQKPQEFIPLDYTNKFDQKQGLTNKQNNIHNQQFQTRKRDNRASTYGLNHSTRVHHLRENGGLTPGFRGINPILLA